MGHALNGGKNMKRLLVILAAIAALGFGGGGYIYYQHSNGVEGWVPDTPAGEAWLKWVNTYY